MFGQTIPTLCLTTLHVSFALENNSNIVLLLLVKFFNVAVIKVSFLGVEILMTTQCRFMQNYAWQIRTNVLKLLAVISELRRANVFPIIFLRSLAGVESR